MALASLASLPDLRERYTDGTDSLAQRMLDAASAAIRDAAGVPITSATSTVTLEGSPDKRLVLPGQPVTAVSAVTIDGEAVTDYKFVSGSLWRWCGWAHCEPTDVAVTMTHGLAAAPADILELCVDLAIAGLLNAGEGTKAGVVGEAIDDYRVTFGPDGALPAMTLPERTRDMLASRFGGGVFVTGDQL